MDNKKQCVSVRMKPSDLHKVERIAKRLGVRNSDVFRYAIKTTLTRLMPLNDPSYRGQRLLNLFVDLANELNRHFDFDADRLHAIINEGIEDATENVDRKDVELLALCGLEPGYLQARLQEVTGRQTDSEEVQKHLKEYLLDKYNKELSSTAQKT